MRGGTLIAPPPRTWRKECQGQRRRFDRVRVDWAIGVRPCRSVQDEQFAIRDSPHHSEVLMFLGIALVLFVIWVLCVLAFKVTVGAIHLLVVIAIIAFIVHFI